MAVAPSGSGALTPPLTLCSKDSLAPLHVPVALCGDAGAVEDDQRGHAVGLQELHALHAEADVPAYGNENERSGRSVVAAAFRQGARPPPPL